MDILQQIWNFIIYIFTLGGNFQWSLVGKYLFFPAVLNGVELTLLLAVISQATGAVIGLFLALFKDPRFVVTASAPFDRIIKWILAPLRLFADFYIWIFRGTPLLVQLVIVFSVFPFFHITVSAFFSAFLALACNEGAYMAEIVRAGISSVDSGQMEAAKSLGMTYGQAMRRIVLPQAFRVIIPPLGNEFNSMMKNTSLAAVISLLELFGTAEAIAAALFANLELYFVACVWYLVMTTIWGQVQKLLERRFSASKQVKFIQRPWWARTTGIGRPTPISVIEQK
ncbi:MAG TPA: amino acid ABC transporter permease [Ktedonobacterales bacterium]|nr:amino acid ABC transporter permease [Ktedonobacterales bacterium]